MAITPRKLETIKKIDKIRPVRHVFRKLSYSEAGDVLLRTLESALQSRDPRKLFAIRWKLLSYDLEAKELAEVRNDFSKFYLLEEELRLYKKYAHFFEENNLKETIAILENDIKRISRRGEYFKKLNSFDGSLKAHSEMWELIDSEIDFYSNGEIDEDSKLESSFQLLYFNLFKTCPPAIKIAIYFKFIKLYLENNYKSGYKKGNKLEELLLRFASVREPWLKYLTTASQIHFLLSICKDMKLDFEESLKKRLSELAQ